MKLLDYILLNHIANKHSDDTYKALKRIERVKADSEKMQKDIEAVQKNAVEMRRASPLAFFGLLVSLGGIFFTFLHHPLVAWAFFFLFVCALRLSMKTKMGMSQSAPSN